MPETRLPVLEHDRYVAASHYADEADRLFRSSWLFLGLASQFAAGPVSIGTAGFDILVEPDGAGLIARRGGAVIELDQCGPLVFGRIQPGGPPLAAFLDPFGPMLAAMARNLTSADWSTGREIACNWKLLAENTLDDCHAQTVHHESLQRTIHRDWLGRQSFSYGGRHSLMENELREKDLAFWRRLERKLPLARYDAGDGYRHLFLFPNFYIASFYDAMIVLHRINPIGPAESVIEITACLPLQGQAPRGALHRAIVADLAGKAEQVVIEDALVCELGQKGRGFAGYTGLLGSRELRIADFQAALLAALPVLQSQP
jgi:phenylpropionate dioxygenase-like ring-hydroxylating dioxygenase large terminal subunit